MSRTVSARIPKQLHEELRERCNEIGESINDFVKASIEFALYQSSEFDFGEPEDGE
jgi:predicted HicB family RNase H-like nuclease